MSSIAIAHTSARPASGVTHDLTSVVVHVSKKDQESADYTSRGWSVVSDEQVRLSASEGGRPTGNYRLTFARAKLTMNDGLVAWHRPTQEPESPISVLPAIVMGQFDDGPYQLFVCSFQGAHMQVAPPEQIVPMPDAGKELMRAVGRDLAALRGAHDSVSGYQIEFERRIADLEGRLTELEAAATAPHKGKNKDATA